MGLLWIYQSQNFQPKMRSYWRAHPCVVNLLSRPPMTRILMCDRLEFDCKRLLPFLYAYIVPNHHALERRGFLVDLVNVIVLCWSPEQVLFVPNIAWVILPGQASALQASVSLVAPSHSLPPWAGAGLVQVRVLSLIPPPHSLLQFPNKLHSENPPSTGMKRTYFKIPILCWDCKVKHFSLLDVLRYLWTRT